MRKNSKCKSCGFIQDKVLHHLLDFDLVWKAYQNSDFPQVSRLLGKRFIKGSGLANYEKRAELIADNTESQKHDVAYKKKIISFLKTENAHVRICDAVEVLCPLLNEEPLHVFRLLYGDTSNLSDLRLKKFEQAYLDFMRQIDPKERRILKPYFDTFTEKKAAAFKLSVKLNKLTSEQYESIEHLVNEYIEEQK